MLSDERYMDEALRLAARGRGGTSPNPMVGAVIVAPNGEIIGAGYHQRAGLPHAEVVALEAAGPGARGATLYCTLEPCCHVGRTGPCVDRILGSGIARVVVAIEDPNPRVNGGGVRRLRERGVEVVTGVRRRDALTLNEAFFTWTRLGRPFVIMKVAASLDGRVAERPGVATRLTSDEAMARVHRLRSEVDAIAVGSGTILVDDPQLTARGVTRSRPLVRVIFDRRLRTPPAARVLATLDAGPVWIVTDEANSPPRRARAHGLRQAGATILTVSGDVGDVMRDLGRREVTSLLLEGGTTVHGAAWAAGVVDRVQVYVAPVALGPSGVPWVQDPRLSIASLGDLRAEICGPDTLIEGYVHRLD